MLDSMLRRVALFLLRLRYRIRIKGIRQVADNGKRRILFLPNHPAFIDPIIIYLHLYDVFKPIGFGDEKQIDRPLVGYLARRWGVRSLPNIAERGTTVRAEVENIIATGIEDLKQGHNLILWPSGTVSKSSYEKLGANSAVETIVKGCPECRVVLVRIRGLWGSSFSWGRGTKPDLFRILTGGVLKVLANLIFFSPRRDLTLELYEPDDFPRAAERNRINRYIEDYYNHDAPPNLYVPYTIWEQLAGGKETALPDPEWRKEQADASEVPASIRTAVTEYLQHLTAISEFNDHDELAATLGLDSLSRTDIGLWLESEFGFPQVNAEALKTVADVMLAASGKLLPRQRAPLRMPDKNWFKPRSAERLKLPAADSINQVFLAQAGIRPGAVAVADQISGTRTYRQIIIAVMGLQPELRLAASELIGIMLPASVGAVITYLATLLAGKTPVMVNWTLGVGTAVRCVEAVNAGIILTSKKFYQHLQTQGYDLSPLQERFLFLEDIGAKISLLAKLKVLICAYGRYWSALSEVQPPEDAVILFTTGSETVPKAVPLTHQNILANISDVIGLVDIQKNEKFIGFLPAFHAFGLTCTMLIPVLCGAQVVFHANPMDARVISRMAAAFQVNIMMGTPTFLKVIFKNAKEEQLHSLRLVVTGSEKCPDEVYDQIGAGCPRAIVLEGYGVTECSPIIALNELRNPVPGSIGKVLPSFEYKLLDPESYRPVDSPGRGVLAVRGPSVFRGYLNPSEQEPFVEAAGKKWYDTGDLVYEDADRVLFFQARLKRFVKIGGEMISLPAVEAVLNQALTAGADEPMLAVEADESDHEPEIVLFTVCREINREKANRAIKEAGMSGLQYVRRVELIDEIPVLGSGKIDYRSLIRGLHE